ncbi:MAG: hypothetical protein AAF629_04400 [Chloroflexota bacterium]
MFHTKAWVQWVVATACGWGMTGAILDIGVRLEVDISFLFLIWTLLFGVLIGSLQWLVLRQYMNRAIHWIWISTVSWWAGFAVLAGLGSVLGNLMSGFGDTDTRATLAGTSFITIALMLTGAIQWLFFRGRSPDINWCIPVFIVTVMLSPLVISPVIQLIESPVVVMVWVGIMSGAGTGLLLIRSSGAFVEDTSIH